MMSDNEIRRGQTYELEGYGEVEVTDLRRQIDAVRGSEVETSIVVEFQPVEPDFDEMVPFEFGFDTEGSFDNTRVRPVERFKEIMS